MPRQKDTKRIDPSRARPPGQNAASTELHNVFKVSGSPIISPRSVRPCIEADSDGNLCNNGESLSGSSPASTTVLVAAAIAANEARKALEAEQVASASLQGRSGVQLVLHQMLAMHTHSLAQLGVARAEFPNTKLSLKQVESLLRPVVTLCNALRADHFGIHVPTPQIARTMNDVHYWKLWESDYIDIGIFFMPPNSTIPLHNHPGMSVVTRVLYGIATVTSYDILSDAEVQMLEAGSEVVYEDATFSSDAVNPEAGSVSWARISREGHFGPESTTWLDPRRFNLHNIQASSDIGCAMLDIMVPPYDNANRDCHHFKILEQKMVRNERIVKMLESVKPGQHMDPKIE
uniref:Cysteine dioxygenase n=1 Tax=Peronospora matthiolae TaxID=2874970 RepID=A0AAV1UN04_9STRA